MPEHFARLLADHCDGAGSAASHWLVEATGPGPVRALADMQGAALSGAERSELMLGKRGGFQQLAAACAALHAAELTHGCLRPDSVLLRLRRRSRSAPDGIAHVSADVQLSAPGLAQVAVESASGAAGFCTTLQAVLCSPTAAGFVPAEALRQARSLEQSVRRASVASSSPSTTGMLPTAVTEALRRHVFTPAVDTFALAVVVYHALTDGCSPFGHDPTTIHYNVLHGHRIVDRQLRDGRSLQAYLQTPPLPLAPTDTTPAGSLRGGDSDDTEGPPAESNLPLLVTDVLASMLSLDAAARPSLPRVLQHPVFWSARRSIARISEFADEVKRRYGIAPPLPAALLPSADWAFLYTDDHAGRYPEAGSAAAGASATATADTRTRRASAGAATRAPLPWEAPRMTAPELVYLEHAFAWHEGLKSDWSAKLSAADRAAGGRRWRTTAATGTFRLNIGASHLSSSPISRGSPFAAEDGAAAGGRSGRVDRELSAASVPAEEHKSPENYFWTYRKRGLYALGIVRAVRNIGHAHAHDYVGDGTFSDVGEVYAYFLEAFPWLPLEVERAQAIAQGEGGLMSGQLRS
jgi:hypothetical protein